MTIILNGDVVSVLYENARAQITLHGATVTTWKTNGRERLWLSEDAALDGSKAIRGGIPVVFPVFGRSDVHSVAALPQHGFARISTWQLVGESKLNDGVAVTLTLSADNLADESRRQWPFGFHLTYTVSLRNNSMETSLRVENIGDKPFDFQALFHSYLHVDDIDQVSIEGLQHCNFYNKIEGAENQGSDEVIRINSPCDRIYRNVQNEVSLMQDGATMYTVERTGLPDVVVWNPWQSGAQSISDFAPEDGYKQMVCIEPGSVSGWSSLNPKSVWTGSQIIHAVM